MAGRDYWVSIAHSADADDLGEHILTGVEIEHDPATNQLRGLGRRTFADLGAPDTAGHFDILLRSR